LAEPYRKSDIGLGNEFAAASRDAVHCNPLLWRQVEIKTGIKALTTGSLKIGGVSRNSFYIFLKGIIFTAEQPSG